jgi:hypothetical protein
MRDGRQRATEVGGTTCLPDSPDSPDSDGPFIGFTSAEHNGKATNQRILLTAAVASPNTSATVWGAYSGFRTPVCG